MEEGNIVKKYHDWLIPVLALLVVFQAITMAFSSPTAIEQKPQPFIPVPATEEVKASVARLAFVPSGVSIKKGEMTNIEVVFSPKRNLKLDGMDIVLVFDPEVIQVTQVTTPKLFSLTTQNKGDEKNGRLYLTFLEEKAEGLSLNSEAKIITLTVKGKALGESQLTFLTADEGPTTVIAENGVSQKVIFDKGSAKVVVY